MMLKTTSLTFQSVMRHSPSNKPHHPIMACQLSCSGWNGLPYPLQPVRIQLADNTALVGAPTQPMLLLISHLKTDLNRLEHWLQDYRNVTNIKNTEGFFLLRLCDASECSACGQPLQWVKLGMTLDIQLIWSAHFN